MEPIIAATIETSPSKEGVAVSSVFLAGYTGSPASRRALAFTTVLAGGSRTTVIALNAYPIVPPSFSAEAVVLGDGEVQDHAQKTAERLLAGLGDADGVHERRAVAGPAPQALIETAWCMEADLIAVGATGRSALGRIVSGSVAERLLHGAPCPVAVVPATWPGHLRRIAVAHDGSDEAGHALEAARDLARDHGANLLLLHVGEGADDTERAADQVGARCTRLDGAAGPALVEACCDGIDLLVCGSRSHGRLHAVLSGCVSRHVVDHAPCPVLVTPRTAVRHHLAADAGETTATG
jgi:nucleotide-binding universal stress UspA family protein